MDLRLDYAAIGMRIRTLRHRQGMTGERLAELADTSKANISHIETPNELLSDNLSPQKVHFERQLASIVENCTPAQLSLIVDLARTVTKRRD